MSSYQAWVSALYRGPGAENGLFARSRANAGVRNERIPVLPGGISVRRPVVVGVKVMARGIKVAESISPAIIGSAGARKTPLINTSSRGLDNLRPRAIESSLVCVCVCVFICMYASVCTTLFDYYYFQEVAITSSIIFLPRCIYIVVAVQY